MKILIDLQGLQSTSKTRGIGRYIESFSMYFVREALKENDIYVLMNHEFSKEFDEVREKIGKLVSKDNIFVFESLSPVARIFPENNKRSSAAEMLYAHFVKSINPDILLVGTFFEGYGDDLTVSIKFLPAHIKTVVILYDFIPYLNQKKYLADDNVKKWYLDKVDELKNVNLLLAISESARDEAVLKLNFNKDSVVAISTDADPKFQKITFKHDERKKILNQYDIKCPYIMYTGVIDRGDSRKNISNLIKAYKKLDNRYKKEFQLVLVGNITPIEHNYFQEYIGDNMLSENVVITGRVNDQDLIALYNLCYLFVLPSLHEGFGLPILEAMRCGAPAIGSNTSSIPEVIGMPEALFDPRSVEDITQKMQQVLGDNVFYQKLLDNSASQSKAFSWKKIVQKALHNIEGITDEGEDQKNFSSLKDMANLSYTQSSREALMNVADTLAQNTEFLEYTTPQLLVDITSFNDFDAGTGIQRVIKKTLHNIQKSILETHQILYVYREDGVYRYSEMSQDIDHAKINKKIRTGRSDIFLGLDLDTELCTDEDAIEFLIERKQKGLKVIFVVYDLIPIFFESFFTEAVVDNFIKWVFTVSLISDEMVCISQSIADELKQWLDQNQPRRTTPLNIGYFHLGADIEKDRSQSEITDNEHVLLKKIDNNAVRFLMVGTIEPRKGHKDILNAMEILWQKNSTAQLIIAGKSGWMVEEFIERIKNHSEYGKKLFWFEGASDQALLALYKKSSALIAASYAEGFGLPLIEAAQKGLPIIARDLPVFREVASEYAYYFSPTDPQKIAEELIAWQNLYKKDHHPKSTQMPHLTWQQSTQQLMDVIFKEQWYKTWQPGQCIVQDAKSSALHTQIGKINNNTIVTTDQAGFLFYSSAQTLEAGHYSIVVQGTIVTGEKGTACLALTQNDGQDILWHSVIMNENHDNLLYKGIIILSQKVDNVDIRLWVDGFTKATFTSLSVYSREKE